MGYFFGAALLAVVGYLVRFRRWAWLIAGYNTSSRASRERHDLVELTRGVGNLAFLLAALLLAAGVGVLVGLDWVTVAAMVLLWLRVWCSSCTPTPAVDTSSVGEPAQSPESEPLAFPPRGGDDGRDPRHQKPAA